MGKYKMIQSDTSRAGSSLGTGYIPLQQETRTNLLTARMGELPVLITLSSPRIRTEAVSSLGIN